MAALVTGPREETLEHVPHAVQAAAQLMPRANGTPVVLPARPLGVVAA